MYRAVQKKVAKLRVKDCVLADRQAADGPDFLVEMAGIFKEWSFFRTSLYRAQKHSFSQDMRFSSPALGQIHAT